jgi:cytochrome c-type biogenesis protein CcmH/NrfG
LQGATEDYRTALRLEPNNPDASYNLEMARSKAGAAKPR